MDKCPINSKLLSKSLKVPLFSKKKLCSDNAFAVADAKNDRQDDDGTIIDDESDDTDGHKDSGRRNGRGASTGDSNDILMWLAVILAAALACSGTLSLRRRKKN